MKKGIILGIITATIIGIVCFLTLKPDPFANIDPDTIVAASEITGNITEKTIGNPEDAELIIYEYADFGCSHCAEWNRKINELIKKYNGKITLVFRNFNLGFKNSHKAASAATAAHIQGYFKEYKDLLFENQAEWFYEKEPELSNLFCTYFKQASNGAGNIEKFKEDINREAVKTRLTFEQHMGKKINLKGTPTFRINGESINLNDLENTIEKLLK